MTSLGATSLPGKRTHLLPSQSASCELTSTSIVWYRDFDLRLRDHQPLTQASRRGCVIPVFIWPSKRGPLAPGGAAQAWLEESLESLDKSLRDIGSRLILRGGAGHVTPDKPTSEELAGDAASHLVSLVEQSGATHVFYHRAYTPDGSLEQDFVNEALTSQGVQCVACAGHLLYEPSAVDIDAGYSGGHWGTLMPFLRACERSGLPPALPLPPPPSLRPPSQWPQSVPLSCLGLATAPVKPSGGDGQHWSKKIMSHWRVGEAAALEMMEEFVSGRGLARYEFDRSCADKRGTVSSLSPYLRFGQLSVRQLYHSVRAVGLDRELTKTFSRRLHWRDLAYYQLACFPHMSTAPIRAHYSSHRWSADPLLLKAWQRGKTGYPMVDAGMRCLWATGWIHQSVRMVTASFLVEYLGVSWVEGARWYHDTLVDADVAINAMMWQNAGRSGIDQWNFVLSPETASQDVTGEFCRKWLPEIARLPNKFLHTPWKAPLDVLARAGVELGVTYPRRIISDLAAARRITVEWLLDARRAALHMNDSGGYDVIALPSGRTTRVFTKEEFRLGADGLVKPPQKGKSRAKPPVKMSKSAKQMAEERGGVAAGSCVVGNSADGGEQELTEVASQSRLTDYFGKGTARRRKIR